jgi:hypothetical protein
MTGDGVGVGALVGNETALLTSGFRIWTDWVRIGVAVTKAESQKSSFDIHKAKLPSLKNRMIEKQTKEICLALSSIPAPVTVQAGFGVGSGNPVGGVLFSAASAGQKNAWLTANSDRIQFGTSVSNTVSADMAASLLNVDTTNDRLTYANLMGFVDRVQTTTINSVMTKDGINGYVLYVGAKAYRQLRNDADVKQFLNSQVQGAVGKDNALYNSNDFVIDNILVRYMPQIDANNTLAGVGTAGAAVVPSFLCGQSALGMAYSSKLSFPSLKETDYDFRSGVAAESCYGISKIASEFDRTGGATDWGVATFFGSSI